jgi:dGTPase
MAAKKEDPRLDRRHNSGEEDQRHKFERDRDRVLYSSALRRLGGVSQVVSAEHIEPFHNRLTHTIKVAQLGRRLAQFVQRQQEAEANEAGLDPEVVEAACLIHDLGHPPFGHVGEEVLNEETIRAGDQEGFEGNAQSFRIITKLSLRSEDDRGLDLTRAVLAASIKYPWTHESARKKAHPKFGAYRTEEIDFKFARELATHEYATIEASLMDYADDIAYSVHDIEDFHRIRAVPWYLLDIDRHKSKRKDVRARELVDAAAASWYGEKEATRRLQEAADRIIERMKVYSPIYHEAYEGTPSQRVSLRDWTSTLIRRFVRDLRPRITGSKGSFRLRLNPDAEAEIRLLKQITRSFIIEGTTIGGQQLGQRRIVREVYADLLEDIAPHRSKGSKLRVVPKKFHHLMADEIDNKEKTLVPVSNARIVADIIASLTERELIAFHRRLRGASGGSIVDPIVW